MKTKNHVNIWKNIYSNGEGCRAASPNIMKTLSWNCHGLGDRATIRALLKILPVEKPDVVFLMKTKMVMTEMRLLNSSKFGYEGCLVVDCEGLPKLRRGGLCMLWRQLVDLQLISFSTHQIMCRVQEVGVIENWILSGIYGWPDGR